MLWIASPSNKQMFMSRVVYLQSGQHLLAQAGMETLSGGRFKCFGKFGLDAELNRFFIPIPTEE